MQFKRLRDPLMKVLFENDDIVAIDKPYGLSSHTNDSKVGNEGYIHQGLIELFESQLGQKLHIVHRLDRTTTGVIVFAKTLEAAAKFQAYFRNRETRKTYLFITTSQIAATSLQTSSPIVVKGAELAAETLFQRLRRSGRFDLWQASPKTGRNHQIRIHASRLGIPLYGDTLYEGEAAPFICLHNARLEFPEGLVIESPMPAYFDTLGDSWFAGLLFEVDRRQRLFHSSASPLRLLTGGDRFADTLVSDDSNLARLTETLGLRLQSDDLVVTENGSRFQLRQGAGLNLEQRLVRSWIFENAQGRAVLNLFAGNGTASVAAFQGGAASVTSVELKKSSLEWARQNFELNSVGSSTQAQFFCRDPLTFLQQNAAKKILSDLIICDVPSFLRRDKGLFKIENDLPALLRDCAAALKPGGQLLISLTAASLKLGDLRSLFESLKLDAAYLLPSLDVALPGEAALTKSFLLQKR